MKLVIITGPQAVGKMTVGQELAKITELKLFYHHMLDDALSGVFDDMPGEWIRLSGLFCEEVLKAYAKSDEYGMIFTYRWAFDRQADWDYIRHIEELFREHGAEIYYVELAAPPGVRLQRNATENRLRYKPFRRDIEKSNYRMMWMEEECRFNSEPGELNKKRYMKINNADMQPEEAARNIKKIFEL